MSAPSLRGLQPNEQITPSLCLVRPLAVGGMATVWIARHHGLQTDVVVKFILAELADEPEVIARFQREASAASDVKSPHVVQMLDHGLTDRGLPFIAMELLEGEDLDARIQRERVLPPTEVAGIVLQVSRALARAHEKKIIHRDIKPENIFLCETGEDDAFVKVLDFGIAKVSTLEQQRDRVGATHRDSDVLGVVRKVAVIAGAHSALADSAARVDARCCKERAKRDHSNTISSSSDAGKYGGPERLDAQRGVRSGASRSLRVGRRGQPVERHGHVLRRRLRRRGRRAILAVHAAVVIDEAAILRRRWGRGRGGRTVFGNGRARVVDKAGRRARGGRRGRRGLGRCRVFGNGDCLRLAVTAGDRQASCEQRRARHASHRARDLARCG